LTCLIAPETSRSLARFADTRPVIPNPGGIAFQFEAESFYLAVLFLDSWRWAIGRRTKNGDVHPLTANRAPIAEDREALILGWCVFVEYIRAADAGEPSMRSTGLRESVARYFPFLRSKKRDDPKTRALLIDAFETQKRGGGPRS
jgi:hypothetical protein